VTVRLLTGLWFGSRDQRLGTAARGRSAGLRLRSGHDLAAATVSARPLFTSSSDNVYATPVTCCNSPSSFSGYLVCASGYLVCAYCVISVLGVRKVLANSVRLLIVSQPKRVPESSEFPFLLRLGHRFFLCDWLEFLSFVAFL
jgi:hypothetical protein